MPVKHVRDVPTAHVEAAKHTSMQVLIGSDEGPNFAMRRFVMRPGGGMPRHTNAIEHEQFVLSGRAAIGIGDEVVHVKPGSVLLIPAGVPHSYETEGDEPFEFLCVIPNLPDEVRVIEEPAD